MTIFNLNFNYKSVGIVIKKGDITLENTQAIVNAANSSLLGGGGVDGAIHRAGGPEILSACKKIREQKGTCPPGEAVITTGGKLNADFVIHTVGPVWKGGEHNEENILKTAYFNSLKLAAENHIESLSFPAISTGIYQFPKETAAKIALETTRDFLDENHIEEIRFILYAERDFKIYENNYRNIFNLY
ncbi:MAG TPA: O-acetyl-ADP-ribose deacetylase [Clostridia bacterium]|nr:O-acetyl-ADP-ribose deacetylase [Clostridia bacterium]